MPEAQSVSIAVVDATTPMNDSESFRLGVTPADSPPSDSKTVPSERYCQVLMALVGFVLIDAFYSILAKDALSSGNTKALVFSFYRDLGAFPILY